MFMKEQVDEVVANAYSSLKTILEEMIKIDEMCGNNPNNPKLKKIREDALTRKKEDILIIMSVTAPLADYIVKYHPEYFQEFRACERIIMGTNYKFLIRNKNNEEYM